MTSIYYDYYSWYTWKAKGHLHSFSINSFPLKSGLAPVSFCTGAGKYKYMPKIFTVDRWKTTRHQRKVWLRFLFISGGHCLQIRLRCGDDSSLWTVDRGKNITGEWRDEISREEAEERGCWLMSSCPNSTTGKQNKPCFPGWWDLLGSEIALDLLKRLQINKFKKTPKLVQTAWRTTLLIAAHLNNFFTYLTSLPQGEQVGFLL